MKQTTAVSIWTGTILFVGLVVAIATRCHEFILYLMLAPFLAAGMGLIHMRIKLPTGLLWAFSFLVLIHCLGGLTQVPPHLPTEGKKLLYNLWIIPEKLKYDQVIHTYGNALATWLCWNILRYSIAVAVKKEITDIPARPVFLLVCFLAGIGIGCLNEILEFGATQAIPGDHNVGGYVNTGWDLVANTLGGGITVLCIYFYRRKGRLPAVHKKVPKKTSSKSSG